MGNRIEREMGKERKRSHLNYQAEHYHKERKTNAMCFAQTSIMSSNLADSSHGTGVLAAA